MGISRGSAQRRDVEGVRRASHGRTLTVNEAEAKAFYEANKEMMGGQPFDQVKGSIEPFLLDQKKAAAPGCNVSKT